MTTEPVNFAYDSEYMKRVLINLVDNALSASESGKPVVLSLKKKKESWVELTVADHGEGIASENLEKIFEPYFSTKRSGVGLGLPIVKKIIEEHGGKVEVHSILQKGTKFSILLPIK